MDRGNRRAKKTSSKQVKNKKNHGRGEGSDDTEEPEKMAKNESSTPLFGTREEPPPDFKDQYLFLLEFFVNHVTGDRLAKLNQMFFVPTSISFEFLDFTEEDEIDVTPVDPLFQPQAGIADDTEYFYSGRSVMFAIDQSSVINKVLDFIVKMSVRKKMPEGVKPDILVGQAELDLSMHFAALRKELLHCWHKGIPPPKTYQGDVPLTYVDQVIGTVSIYVRMSAFGQTIVTEFEAPPKKTVSTYVFKGDEMNDKSLAYKCRLIDSKTVDICRDSKDDLSRQPCRVCIPDNHPCSPCGHHAGATSKIYGSRVSDQPLDAQGPGSNVQFESRESKSRQESCSDGPRQGGLIQTSRGPAQPCGKAVVLKVSGLLDADGSCKKPTVTVASESEAVGPENPPDPEHDVFVLRIGKKGLVGVGEKSDIQLEMRTPKGPQRKPPIRYETREMQTEEDKRKRRKKGKKKK